ncbi:hypothetical protein SARC_06652 [Sphaeroforma arctica JP610]|uniref:Uncharacterized protein n=1 Tax=Sphaeroforma arctica JP610 TaxID=667725 RepID=A0A0L0FWR4_9EUKA|nr:hypothetical protein SARC_06652 [Sphaeroforma arctica JP610]KNC81006.1 hypothetical protein SARC_06652 [Sphaeroforma arctica JP610]|eukprot:XP_014154908.1 hypothetical protein SARC_06652 [Sphaeroforma arctica JP610]
MNMSNSCVFVISGLLTQITKDNPDKANEEAIADEKKVVSAVDTLMNTVGVERVKAWRKQYYTDSLIHQIVFAAGSNSATSQALQRGITALERLVSTHGMDINSQRGSDGCTPAHISGNHMSYLVCVRACMRSCMRRNGTLLNKLVSLGADLSVEDASGTSVRVQDELWRRSDELAEAMLPLWESGKGCTLKFIYQE